MGPYVKYGAALAAACAEAGTHYCDLTGEVLFVHRSIAANSEAAKRTGARIIHACGFDSIPSDLGVMLTAEAARADGAELRPHPPRRAHAQGRVQRWHGRLGAHPGHGEPEHPSVRRVLADPLALADGPRRPRTPTGSASPPGRGGLGGLVDTLAKASPVKRDADNGHFTGPFVMAAFNSRIVARSASLLGYGEGFRYVEYTDFGGGARGAVTAGVTSVALGAGLAGLAFGPTRAILDRVLPSPGEGPSLEAQEKGRLKVDIIAEATNGARYRTTVTAPYDPGYQGTA